VATGFGRTGTLFACEQERVRPDILCLAKSLTGGYSPLAVTMTTNSIFQAFRGPLSQNRTFFHGHTYTAHPLGTAVALANLKLSRNIKLLEKSRRMAKLMREELEQYAQLPRVRSIRQAGLMVGVELDEEKGERVGAKICRQLLSKGIWLRPLGNVIVLMPPPVISAVQLRTLLRSVYDVILNEKKN